MLPVDEPVGPVVAFDMPEPSASGLVRSGLLVSAITLLTNAFNVIFHFATARILNKGEYSLLTTMFAVQAIGTVPLLATQATITREVSLLIKAGDRRGAGIVIRSGLRAILRAGVVLIAVAIVLMAPLFGILHVARPLPILAVTVAFLVAIPNPLLAGVLQATERFKALSWTQTLQASLKLGAGLAIAGLGLGASAITFGVAGAIAVSAVIMLIVVRPLMREGRGELLAARRVFGRYSVGAAVALALQTALVSTDIIWARAGLTAADAGLYAAVSVATSIILLVPAGVTTVLFPRVARLGDLSRERGHLVWGLAAVGVLCVIAVGVMALIPKPLLHLSFGSQYDGAVSWLAPLGIAMGLYALSVVYINHFLAVGKTRFVFLITAVFVLQQALFLAMHKSGPQIVTVQIICSATLVLGSELYERLSRRR